MESNAEIQDLFSKSEYSDLTIKLSDGQEFRVHKFIVCMRNEYFLKLCGLQSRFAESQQEVIQLKDDDPTALKWRFWTNLHTAADKYLIPKLSAAASDRACSIAKACTSIDDIFDILEVIRTDLNHNDMFVRLAATLRENHVSRLLKHDRYRAQLDSGGKDALWQQLDELSSTVLSTDRVEKSHTLCQQHGMNVFQETAKNGKALCWCCNQFKLAGIGGYSYTNTGQVARKAWIEK